MCGSPHCYMDATSVCLTVRAAWYKQRTVRAAWYKQRTVRAAWYKQRPGRAGKRRYQTVVY